MGPHVLFFYMFGPTWILFLSFSLKKMMEEDRSMDREFVTAKRSVWALSSARSSVTRFLLIRRLHDNSLDPDRLLPFSLENGNLLTGISCLLLLFFFLIILLKENDRKKEISEDKECRLGDWIRLSFFFLMICLSLWISYNIMADH